MECVPTIFDRRNQLDGPAIADVVEYLIEGGIQNGTGCLLIGGAVGQFMTMTLQERMRLFEVAAGAAGGRVPTVMGCQSTSTDLSLQLVKHAASVGADAVQLSPPHYYFSPQLSQDDVFRFFADLADEVDIAMAGYHNWWSSVGIDPETLLRLAEELDSFVAVKWRGRTDFENYIGYKLCADKISMIENSLNLMLTAPHQMGARGFISYLGLIWPEYDLELWRLLEERRYAEAGEKMLSLILPIYELTWKVSGEHSNIMAELTRLAGLPTWVPRRPTRPLSEPFQKELRKILEKAGCPRLANPATRD